MSAPANCKLVGRWRIVKADIWDRDHLDVCGPAMITITDHRRGEITFGALQAGLEIEYSRSSIGFTGEGFDEMDEVSGDGSAELLDDGSIEIEFAYHTATKPPSKPNERLLEQPARVAVKSFPSKTVRKNYQRGRGRHPRDWAERRNQTRSCR
jgi:hypothetical protein